MPQRCPGLQILFSRCRKTFLFGSDFSQMSHHHDLIIHVFSGKENYHIASVMWFVFTISCCIDIYRISPGSRILQTGKQSTVLPNSTDSKTHLSHLKTWISVWVRAIFWTFLVLSIALRQFFFGSTSPQPYNVQQLSDGNVEHHTCSKYSVHLNRYMFKVCLPLGANPPDVGGGIGPKSPANSSMRL